MEKTYYQMFGIGRTKYSVHFHDGQQTHKDGSPFFDIRLFTNKRKEAAFIKELIRSGYIYHRS